MTFWSYYKKHKDNIDGLLIDVDGTLSVGSKAIGEVDKFLEEMRSDGKAFYILTNDGNHSIKEKCGFLHKAGLDIQEDELISCASVLRYVAEENDWVGKKFFVVGELGTPCFAELAGLQVTRNIDELNECLGAIQGEGVYNWQTNLEAIFGFFLANPDRHYIVPNPDSFWPMPHSTGFGIGAGGQARMIINILREVYGKFEPIYLGKPYPGIYDYALSKLSKKMNIDKDNLDRSRVYGIGDYLNSDIKGANLSGLTSVLVCTGATKREQLQNGLTEEQTPKLVFNSLA